MDLETSGLFFWVSKGRNTHPGLFAHLPIEYVLERIFTRIGNFTASNYRDNGTTYRSFLVAQVGLKRVTALGNWRFNRLDSWLRSTWGWQCI